MQKIDLQELTCQYRLHIRLGDKSSVVKADLATISINSCSRNQLKYLQITRQNVTTFTKPFCLSQY